MKAVILLGGPSKGTNSRPLCFGLVKPLFPIAGKAMVDHHLQALSAVGVDEVLLIGFFEEAEMQDLLNLSNKYPFKLRYLREFQPLGTAGGLYHFRDQILQGEDEESLFFVLHVDVACNFPLKEMLEFHKGLKDKGAKDGHFTCMSVENSKKETKFGQMAINEDTKEVLHFAEKPECFVSDYKNGGVYIFSVNIFHELGRVFVNKNKKRSTLGTSGNSRLMTIEAEQIQLEQDVLTPLSGTGLLYTFLNKGPWCQVKTAETALQANSIYLDLMSKEKDNKLSKEDNIVGNVFINGNAEIHPTAKIGPDVVIGERCRIGPGARLKDCIVLNDVQAKEHSLIVSSVVGWKTRVGRWSRVQGTRGESEDKLFSDGRKNPSITIIGHDVNIADEHIIRDCIVLPKKNLVGDFQNEVLL